MANDRWYKSKTKWAGILGGVSLILPSVVAWLNGSAIDIGAISAGFTIVLGAFGVRDALV